MSANQVLLLVYLTLTAAYIQVCLSALNFDFSLCSESHTKKDYAIHEPVKCESHTTRFTKQCSVNIFKQEH